ncbi:L-aminoadipate-semialdehyde dehydrogenase [Pyricularia oryzae 70-15]|uniref:L-aminoadipate-semialdehyde dehydrogenase n=3 Tax=Pyricularia oryzae TaxID=318829 RepID=G4NCL3_PYRO7|nr:L-aminoadipate-semialdehyde dehydrogenase [Pyricularia oryzae 70-15]EHA49107.1 L-aminoadipate-semialdehyde dehydrogenase [Pyricularia oryzae 70-15]ELQ35545.1 L-aminoadipate-semialdehyde dehydrogenase [Pyricularia oryzae Y34]KAI7915035.1 L-aminoadipate-semialdehyde dehydrogenase [Pyricularia oryzae]KAI7924283.1 L-aminoadipate-semialdehyde dehydrogenase [Pyricularia oryzae]
MSPALTIPYGRRLIPQVLDDLARTTPDREMFSVPRSDDPKDGWKTLSYGQVAGAVDRVAGYLLEQKKDILSRCASSSSSGNSQTNGSGDSRAQDEFPTLAYLGPSDARYVIFAVACVKAGMKALFISPRNPKAAQLNLFDKTNCNAIYYDPEYDHEVRLWLDERTTMMGVRVHSAQEWIDGWGADKGSKPAHVPYTKTFEEAEWDPFMVMHTSGSTGFPKPVFVRVGMLAVSDSFHSAPEFMGSPTIFSTSMAGRRILNPMPLFHAAGLYVSLLRAVYFAMPVALGITSRPVTPQSVMDALANVDVDMAILPPAILDEIAYIPEAVDALRRLDYVLFGGGPLNPEAGDRLSVREGVRLLNMIGYTEAAPLAYHVQRDPKLWQWFIVDSERMGNKWVPYGDLTDEGEVYEHVIKRKEKNDPPGSQGIFYTFPDLHEYPTKDLYIKHPTLPNHWKYHGRADDVIVFSNGEKLNPVSIEAAVASHPDLKAAMVVGAGRFQPALIVEPALPELSPKNDQEADRFVERIWPLVEEANRVSVAHGRIAKELILVASPHKPFPRAGKGTVQRPAAVKLYKLETDALYEKAGMEADGAADSSIPIDVSSKPKLAESIRELFEQLGEMNNKGKKLALDRDFFTAGVDSLQVLNAVRMIRRGLEAAGLPRPSPSVLAPRFIYAHPTAEKLAAYVFDTIIHGQQNGHANGNNNNNSGPSPDIQAMKAQLEKYTRGLRSDPASQKNKPAPSETDQTIILTGSTGALGSYILDMLQSSASVGKIICLNRGDDSGARQKKLSAERGLATSFAKVEFYNADLSRPDLGLDAETYDRLLRDTDRIVHNAWPVNFNMSVETFEPHVASARNFVDLALKAAKNVHVVFVSSIGTADGWTGAEAFPERRSDDLTLPSTGYGRSKLVSSLIFDEARERSGVSTAVVRVGQIAGPRGDKGAWNRQEWLPSIVASSLALGALPGSLGPMDDVEWTPTEDMAKLILEVADILPTREGWKHDNEGYFHGVNPRSSKWSELVPHVHDFYGDRIKEIVPIEKWVELLEKSASDTKNIEKNPGVKLLDFYQGLLHSRNIKFDMRRTCELSPTMASLEAVTPELMKNWCRQWEF